MRAELQETPQLYCWTQELKAQLLGDQEAHKPKQKRKAAPKAGGDADKTGMEEANKEEGEDRDDEANQPPLKKVTCRRPLPYIRWTALHHIYTTS